MASSPQFKVHDGATGEYVASARDATLAAAILAALPERSYVKLHGRIIFREGDDGLSAAESYDAVADLIYARIDARRAEATGVVR